MSPQLADAALGALRAENRAAPTAPVWSSDLSVDETVVLEETGWAPCGLVSGSSVFHIGYVWPRYSVSQEIVDLSAAMHNARLVAMSRLAADVSTLGGSGVIGVRVAVELRGHQAEFLAVGTAIRPTRPTTTGAYVFTSDLGGQDFTMLWRAGYLPTQLVMGVCVYHAAHQSVARALGNAGRNAEIPTLTEALYDARELAMGRLQSEARGGGATGVVGMRITESSHVWGHNAIEFLALGTGIRPVSEEHRPVTPSMAIDLSAGGRVTLEGVEEPSMATGEELSAAE